MTEKHNLVFTTSLNHMGTTFDNCKITRRNDNGIILGHLRIAPNTEVEGKHGHFIFINPTTYKLYVGEGFCKEQSYDNLDLMLEGILKRMSGHTIETSQLVDGSFRACVENIIEARQAYVSSAFFEKTTSLVSIESVSNFGIF